MNELGIVLKQLRENRNYTIKELSEKSKVGNGTIGDIERGKNKTTIKTLEKLSKALNLTESERERLFSTYVSKDISEKILEPKMNKRERNQFENILNSASHLFNDEKVSEEDKMKMRDSLLEAFYDAKSKNKRK